MKSFSIFYKFFVGVLFLSFFTSNTWGACTGTNRGSWSSGATYTNTNFTNDFYTLNIAEAGTLNLTVTNTSSGFFTRNITYTLYKSNACNAPVILDATLTKSNTSNVQPSLEAGIYTLQLSRNNSRESGYSWNGTFTPEPQVPPVIASIPNQTATINTPFVLNLTNYVTLTNGDSILQYTLTGTLPPGLSFNSSNGVISGSPTTITSTSLSIIATDDDGDSNSRSFTLTTIPPSADLAITKTATSSVRTNNTIEYTISVQNNGPVSSNNITVTDVLPASVTYQTAYGNDWICSYTSGTRTVSCIHPTELSNNATTQSITIVVVAPSTAQTVSNTATVTSYVNDDNAANNSSSASTTVSSASFSSSNERPFTLQKQYNINGNMKVIGNSMLLRSNGQCAGTGTDNNDIDTMWANRDTDSTTWNASSADLELPPGVKSANIKYAALYWQGRVDSDNDNSTFWTNAKTIKFKAPGLSYQTLTSSDAKYNWTLRSSDANYQGVVDVTSIIKQSIDTVLPSIIDSNGFSGTFWGANIQAERMRNGFGAWSLVLIYEDYEDTLKNISLYDGYVSVDNGETIPTTLSGFLTPTSGAVESNFLVFAGEGDVTLTDSVTLSNSSGDQSLGNNIFNSSQTIDGVQVTNRDPSCQNTIGIDIDSFNVGTTSSNTPIIRNNQTSTIVKLRSTGDVYYPGVFAFSTQLYTPDVCYLEDVTFNNSPISSSNLPESGDQVEYVVSITNKDNEVAKGVFVEKIFDDPDGLQYVTGSMSIAPIPGTLFELKSDNTSDDTAEYSAQTDTIKFLLGNGATWYEGGSLSRDVLTKFKYLAEVGDKNASQNTYLVSYRNDLLRITFTGIPIRKCQDFDNSFEVYVPVIGKYNTVRTNSGIDLVNGPDPLDPLDVKNALYTQIVNQPFNVNVISFANDNMTPLTWSGDLNLTIVQLENGGTCDDINTTLSNTYPLTFSNEKYKEVTVTADKASKNAVFRMVTDTAAVCSRDSFAVRPASFKMDANDTILVGNRPYEFTFKASHQNAPNTASLNYNQEIHNMTDKNATTQLIIPTGCTLPSPIEYTSSAIPFSDGQVTAIIIYPNIGDIEFKLTDNKWSSIDKDLGKGDCIVDSAANTPDINGKVGCMVQTAQTFTFVPENFISTLTLENDSMPEATYLSNEQNMSAILTLDTMAVLNGGSAASNYTANCFARNIETTITLANNKALTWSDTQTRINFFDDLNSTSQLLNQTANTAVFATTEGNFTDGSSSIIMKINFDRNTSTADNPFNISRNDFNITQIIDTDGVIGNDFNRTNDMNATFIYGRTNGPRQRFIGNNANVLIHYEAYCDLASGCDKSLLPNGLDSNSTDDPRWFTNTFHNATSGDIGTLSEKNGSGRVTPNGTSNLNNGITTTPFVYELNNSNRKYPYKTTMENNASSWLIYHPFATNPVTNEFEVEFDNTSGNWAGVRETNTTTSSNAAPKTNRRVMW